MAKFPTASVSFPELAQLQRDLSQYTGYVQRKYMKSAVKQAMAPGVAALKRTTPKGPTGNLRRSIAAKVVTYKDGAVVGVIGFRAERGKNDPKAKGFHQGFLEFGTAERVIRSTSARGFFVASSYGRKPFKIVRKAMVRGGRSVVQANPKYPKSFFKSAAAGQKLVLPRMPIGGSTGKPPVATAFAQSVASMRSEIKQAAATALENAAKDKFARYRPLGT